MEERKVDDAVIIAAHRDEYFTKLTSFLAAQKVAENWITMYSQLSDEELLSDEYKNIVGYAVLIKDEPAAYRIVQDATVSKPEVRRLLDDAVNEYIEEWNGETYVYVGW